MLLLYVKVLYHNKYKTKKQFQDFVLGEGHDFISTAMKASFHLCDHPASNYFKEVKADNRLVPLGRVQKEDFVRLFSLLMRDDFRERARPNLHRQLAITDCSLKPFRQSDLQRDRKNTPVKIY
jgi:hypothetical protein